MTTTENILKIEKKAKPSWIQYTTFTENPSGYLWSIIDDPHNYNNKHNIWNRKLLNGFNELSLKMCEDKLQGISPLFDLHFFFNL